MRPLPTVGDWTFRTLSRLGGAIELSSGKRRRLMLVTRTDLYSAGDLPSWGALTAANEGPWELVSQREAAAVRLHLHADATGRTPEIFGEAAPPLDFSPPDVPDEETPPPPEPLVPVPPAWSEIDTEALHDALFHQHLEHALGLISALPVEPPVEDDPPPPPVLEAILFGGNLAAVAFEGQVDVPFDAPDEVLPNPATLKRAREARDGAQSTRNVA